jgi:hypothetical protein
MSRLPHLLPALVLLAGCGEPPAPSPPSTPAPPTRASSFCLRDINGTEHRPFDSPDVKAVVLVFVLPDCPIANGYAPEINRLAAAYAPRGARFFLVQVDPDLTADDAGRHAREFGYTFPVVHDSRHDLVHRSGATMVPEAAVFAPDGRLCYRGRIDDQYAALGKRRAQAASHDLRDALDAVLAGRPVASAFTEAVGCSIPPLPTRNTPP